MKDPKQVLIVDQSSIFRNTLKDVIKISGIRADISEADNAEQALEILKDVTPRVIFLDIAFSENNGFELLKKMKGLKPDTRIAVLSSHDSAEYEEASILKGAEYFLSKERMVGLHLLDVIRQTLQ